MLSPEEKALLANTQSLIQQIMQSSDADSTDKAEDAKPEDGEESGGSLADLLKKAEMEDENSPEDEKEDELEDEAKKAEDEESTDDEAEDKKEELAKARKARKAEEGSTASDDAEERLEDDLPTITEEGLAAVKSLLKKGVITVNTKKVNKSNTALMRAVSDLTIVMKSVIKDQRDISKAVYSILDGMGVAGEIRKSMESTRDNRQVQKSVKSVQDMSVFKQEILDGVQALVGGQVQKESASHSDVRKGLADFLGSGAMRYDGK